MRPRASSVLLPRAALLLCALWVCQPSPASAEERLSAGVEARARAAFDSGRRLFEAGSYVDALAEFSAGYELSRRPLFLFNMGECARMMRADDRARGYFERYLAEDRAGTFADVARQRLAALSAPLRSPAARVALAPPPIAEDHPLPLGAVATSGEVSAGASPPLWKRWPFWLGIGATVVVTTLLVTSLGDESCDGACVDLRE